MEEKNKLQDEELAQINGGADDIEIKLELETPEGESALHALTPSNHGGRLKIDETKLPYQK